MAVHGQSVMVSGIIVYLNTFGDNLKSNEVPFLIAQLVSFLQRRKLIKHS